MRRVLAFFLGVAGGCAAVDITYRDAAVSEGGAPDATTVDGGGAPSSDAAGTASDAVPPIGDGAFGPDGECPCDPSQGLGCCIPKGERAPFCSADVSGCVDGGGVFAGCTGYDPATESVCCWNGPVGAGGFTTLAGSCGARAIACTLASDCSTQGGCSIQSCKGFLLGACGATAPACP
jgi:hypothetical protein